MEAKTVNKPQRLANYAKNREFVDTLQVQSTQPGVCTGEVCGGSLSNSRRASSTPRSPSEVLQQAQVFLDAYYTSLKLYRCEVHLARWEEVAASVARAGTYHLTKDELLFGAKQAWRNAPRCIGRIQWNRLQVFDARDVTTPRQMFQALCNHIKYSTNGGNIRSAITVFPARRAGQRDFRVWNPQMISYAGYTNADGSVTGDPAYTTFTQVCQQLGWTGAGGRFDVLPLVVSAATGDPECFPIPEDLVLQVELHHPGFDWFRELGLRWFALPGVSSMLFDCGGVEFPAAPFNGWYMSTEIATRDLCDTQRYNLLQVVGERMGLDTRSNMTLWKDTVALEINKAVLHSFQEAKVTMVDHHTASESFMQFMENEHRERGGCPADWVWIVPPFSAALTPVFHQEMSLYYLKPSYEYQQPAWVAYARHVSALAEENTAARAIKLFRKVAMAVVFASVLYREALSKRVRVTIVYASETGRSQSLAHSLNHVFKFNFNSKVMCMSDYQVNQDVWDESLLLVVASTTGTGEPPTNGQEFVKSLYALKENASRDVPHDQKLSFWEDYNTFQNSTAASRSPVGVTSGDEKGVLEGKEGSGSISSLLHRFRRRWESKEDLANTSTLSVSDPVRYAVFALGSTNYTNFCAFGKYVDYLLGESGGCRLLQLTCGDELNNQEDAFNTWTERVFKAASQEFGVGEGQMSTLGVVDLRADNVKLIPATRHTDLLEGLSQLHMKKVQTVRVLESKILHEEDDRWSQVVGLEVGEGLQYQPGDHVGLLPLNNPDLVTSILARLQGCRHADTPVQVLLKRGTGSQGDAGVYWEQHPRLPVASPRLLLSHYLDINTPPTPAFLQLLAAHAVNNHHASTLTRLAQEDEEYRGWRAREYPHLLEVLEMFRSVEVEVGVVVAALPVLQPRYYSISSSPLLHPRLLHITLSGVQYRTRGGSGPVHQGVATGFLKNIRTGDSVQLFHRSVASFHLPSDPKVPVVLVGAGSGIAPFRGFWQHYHHMRTQAQAHCGGGEPGRVLVYYGCRTHADHLYDEEKHAMLTSGAITSSSLALSRQPGVPKMHVQELLLGQGRELQQHLVEAGGHVYVCGGEAMARGVYRAFNTLLQQHGALSPEGARAFLSQLKEENRYHEDTFGVRVGTAPL